MLWLSFAGEVSLILFSVWLLLLAYRVIGKEPGKDTKYDASIEYWAGTFKVMGVLGIIVLILHLVALLVERL